MRTNYLRHLANIVDILWSRPVWGGGGHNSQLNWLTCCKRQKCNFAVAGKHDAVLEVIDVGYEPANLTVHPPPKTVEGGFIFFV